MLVNPLLDKINSGKTALGLIARGTEMVEVCAFLGLDYFVIDQMFTKYDWSMTKEMIRTGEAAGITPMVRVQSNPWLGYDHRIAVDVTRNQGLGAQFIKVSYSCKKEIEECLMAAKDWHRSGSIHPFKSLGEWDQKIEKMRDQTFIIPACESKGALEELEETLSLPGVKIFAIAMTDLSKVITGSDKPDWYHPKLWEYVDKAVALGKEKGVIIAANTSYTYDIEDLKKRVKKLHDAGVRVILLQTSSYMFQLFVGHFLEEVRENLGL